MPEFNYIASDGRGRRVSGVLQADDAASARKQIGESGLVVEQLSEVKLAVDSSELSDEETVQLASQIAGLADAELPLAPGLRAAAEELADQWGGRRLATALRDIADRLEAGQTLPQALSAEDRRFPEHLRGVVAAGLRAGNLQETLMWLVDSRQRVRQARQRLTSAIAYPAILLGLLGCLFVLVSVFVVSGFKEFFEDFEAELPALTAALIWFSTRGLVLVLALFVVFLLVVGAVRLFGGRASLSRVAHCVPLLGRVWYHQALVELSGLLSLLIRQKVPLPDALQITGRAIRDRALGEACLAMAQMSATGEPMAEQLDRIYSPLGYLAPIVAWGEANDSLAEAFDYISLCSDADAELFAEYIRLILPPFTFVVIICGASFILSALFLPVIKLANTLL